MKDDRLQKYLLDWYPQHGKRSIGRRRTTWINCIEDDLELVTGRIGISYQQGKDLALNRLRWRELLRISRDTIVEQPDPHNDDG